VTFIEWPVIAHGITAWNRLRALAKRGAVIAERFATLEARVTTIEATLAKQPGDACPYCGERTMRMEWSSHALGEPRKQWRREKWTCASCIKSEDRIKQF